MYLQKTLHSDILPNKIDNTKQISSQRDNSKFKNFKLRDNQNISHDTSMSKTKKIEYNHKDIILDKKMTPSQNFNTNKNDKTKFVH